MPSFSFQDILHICRDMCMKYHLKAVTPGTLQISGPVLVDFTTGPPVYIGLMPFSSTFLCQHTCIYFCYVEIYVLFFLGKRKTIVLWYASNVAASASTIFG